MTRHGRSRTEWRLRPLAMVAFALALVVAAGPVRAATARVAVASNFAAPARELARLFEERSNHRIEIVTGSTGQLYAQIEEGAPFHLFLAADAERPARLVEDGQGVAGSVFTYAYGRLILWSPEEGLFDTGEPDEGGLEVLREQDFDRLAIANPELAPYGAAAQEAMEGLGVWESLDQRLVRAGNIAQAFTMVDSGNAQLGFVALSSLIAAGRAEEGSRWDVPPSLHSPIRQNAVLLAAGADNAAARGFHRFLRQPAAAEVIGAYGYDLR